MKSSGKNKQETIKKFQLNATDVGSPEVQVALLTKRIGQLTKHFEMHRGDKHSQVGMMKLIANRKSHLLYLKNQSADRYKNLIAELGLRK